MCYSAMREVCTGATIIQEDTQTAWAECCAITSKGDRRAEHMGLPQEPPLC